MDHVRVATSAASAREPAHRRVRLAVVIASVVAAAAGSLVLATRDSAQKTTTRGITATLRVPGHPGAVVAAGGVLWVALSGDPRSAVTDRPLLRLGPTGNVVQAVRLGGEASTLGRDGGRLIASVEPLHGSRLGARRLVALDWRTGAVLPLGDTHLSDTDAREIGGPVDRIVRTGNSLWALEAGRGTLWQLDPATLAPFSAPLRLASGRTLGLAAGDGYLWVTATDAGDVLRIDPASGAITPAHVGGTPVGIAVAGGEVWFADRSSGKVVRLDPHSLRPIGDPIRVGAKPSWLGAAGNSLFVSDEDAGTVARIDARSGQPLGPPIRIAPTGNEELVPTIAPNGASVWVSSFASNTLTRIGSRSALTAFSGEVTVKETGSGPVNPGPNGNGVTDGGIGGTGHFVVTGAINDKGTYIGYRSVRGQIAKIRTVLHGKQGTIIIVTTVHLGAESPAPWTITSATNHYSGLRGSGKVTVDNYEADPYTSVLKGTVSR